MDSIFVAASSEDLDRAELFMKRLRLAGWTVTSTWTESVRQVGAANPRDATAEQRYSWAWGCEQEVASAHVFLFLLPAKGKSTCGGWVELGMARKDHKQIVIAGEDATRSIYTSYGECIDDDMDAFAFVCGLRNS